MTENQRIWAQSRDRLVSAVVSLGYPSELGELLARELKSPKAIDRMTSYIYQARPRTEEMLVDEMLAIRADIDAWHEKKQMRQHTGSRPSVAEQCNGFVRSSLTKEPATLVFVALFQQEFIEARCDYLVVLGRNIPIEKGMFTPVLRTEIKANFQHFLAQYPGMPVVRNAEASPGNFMHIIKRFNGQVQEQ